MMSYEDQTAPVAVPDVNPRALPQLGLFSMTAGDFLDVYRTPGIAGYSRAGAEPWGHSPSFVPLNMLPRGHFNTQLANCNTNVSNMNAHTELAPECTTRGT